MLTSTMIFFLNNDAICVVKWFVEVIHSVSKGGLEMAKYLSKKRINFNGNYIKKYLWHCH